MRDRALSSSCARGLQPWARWLPAHPGGSQNVDGFEALGIPSEERFVALIDLGWPRQHKQRLTACANRVPPSDVVTYLD